MSLICRVIIGYFDPYAACVQPSITPTRPVDEEEVVLLQAARDEAFGIKLSLSNRLTPDGFLCIQDGGVRGDTYKAAALAHGLFRMSVIDHAHHCVIFPTEHHPLPERDHLIGHYRSHFRMDEQRSRQEADKTLRWMREKRESERAVQERVQSFAATWRSRIERGWLTPTVLALAQVVCQERQFDVLPILADALEESGCMNEVILEHLRRPGPHTHGCWAVNLLLAKEQH